MGYSCHVVTASAQTESSPDVAFIEDDLRPIWDGTGEQKKSFKAYQELLVRKAAFPGHIGIMWSFAAAAHCHQLVRKYPAEKFVVFSTYPPLGVIPAGLMAYLRDRLPWIADFRDPLSLGLGDKFLSARQRFWNQQLEARVFRQAAAVIANVDGAAAMWRERYPRQAKKLHVIPNGFDPEDAPRAREIPQRSQKLIVHAGGLYHGLYAECDRRVAGAVAGARRSDCGENSTSRARRREDWAGQTALRSCAGRRLAGDAGTASAIGSAARFGRSRCVVADPAAERCTDSRQALRVHLRRASGTGAGAAEIGDRRDPGEVGDSPRVRVQRYAASAADQKLVEFLRLPTTPTQPSEWFRTNFNAEEQTKKLAGIVEQVSS